MISDAVFSAAVGCQIKWVYNAAHRLTRPGERTAASVAWWRLVHHLAGELGLPLADAERTIIGTLRLLEGCARIGVRKVIFAARGDAFYGDAKKVPVAERTYSTTHPRSPEGIGRRVVLGLSFDHRVADPTSASQYLERVGQLLGSLNIDAER